MNASIKVFIIIDATHLIECYQRNRNSAKFPPKEKQKARNWSRFKK